MQPIKIGTRGSKLALWQANYVANRLKAAGVPTEIITIETKGDKKLDVAIGAIGSKGVFTEEIEEQLGMGSIDLAVHSAKDMQSRLPEGFELLAFTEREVVNDVLVGHDKQVKLDNGYDWVIGTSSTRRVATLRHYYPHIKTIAVRGNLQTRIRKMEEGQCDAMLLAYAGVHRMQYDDMILQHMPLDIFTPAVGQGSVAVEINERLANDKKELIKKQVNHPETETRLRAERAYLKTIEGGCSIPAFALAELHGKELIINGGIISMDGKQLIRHKERGDFSKAEDMGHRLAERVLADGGAEIVAGFKS